MPEPARSEGEPETPATPDAASGGDTPDLAQAEEAAAREAAAEASPSGSGAGSGPKVGQAKVDDEPQGRRSPRGRVLEGRRPRADASDEGGFGPPPPSPPSRPRPPRRPSRPPRPRSRGRSPRPSTSARAAPTGSPPRTSTSAAAASAGPNATDIAVSQGGIGLARGERVSVELGGVGAALGGEVRVTQGGVYTVLAREVHLEQSIVRTVIANEVQADRTTGVLLLLARRVDGDVQDDPRLARRARVRGGLRDRLDAPAPPPALTSHRARRGRRAGDAAAAGVRATAAGGRTSLGLYAPRVRRPPSRSLRPTRDRSLRARPRDRGPRAGRQRRRQGRASGTGPRSGPAPRIGAECVVGRDAFIDEGVTIGDRVKIQNPRSSTTA